MPVFFRMIDIPCLCKPVLPATMYKTGDTRSGSQDTLDRVVKPPVFAKKALARMHGKSWCFSCTVRHTAVFGIQLLLPELPELPTGYVVRAYVSVGLFSPTFCMRSESTGYARR